VGPLEHEYIGRNTIDNADRLEKYINDLTYNQPLTNSQITSRLGDFLVAMEATGRAIKAIEEYIKTR
jgi:hypothetical protein